MFRRLSIFLSIFTAIVIGFAGVFSYVFAYTPGSWVGTIYFWFFLIPVYYVINAIALAGKSNFKKITYIFTVVATILICLFIGLYASLSLKAIYLRMTGQATTAATFNDMLCFFYLILAPIIAIGNEVVGLLYLLQERKAKQVQEVK